jgi:hypothetical protein
VRDDKEARDTRAKGVRFAHTAQDATLVDHSNDVGHAANESHGLQRALDAAIAAAPAGAWVIDVL